MSRSARKVFVLDQTSKSVGGTHLSATQELCASEMLILVRLRIRFAVHRGLELNAFLRATNSNLLISK